MNAKTKNFFKSFTPYQIWYLVIVFVITALFVIFLPEMMLEDMSNPLVVVCSVVAVLANPVCELLISKQSKMNFMVDLFLIEIPELVICLAMGWYSIAIVTMCFWVPIDIVSFVKWTKYPDAVREEETVVKRLSWKQDVFIVLGIIVFSLAGGYLINKIPGAADSYLDAFAAACGMANGILLLLRYSEQWYAWMMTLILYAFLYFNSGSYIMLVTVAAMAVNTCYGFAKWLKYTREHQNAQPAKQSE